MSDPHCVRIKLKPGSLARVRTWAAEINARNDDALATLRDEGVILESWFLDSSEAGDYLIGYIRASNLEQAHETARASMHDIDAYHQAFKKDTWESGYQLELLVDLADRT